MCYKSLAIDSLALNVVVALTILHAVAYVSRRVVQFAPTQLSIIGYLYHRAKCRGKGDLVA
jgi:hypothetical protein